jgi:phage baseplate assembly protein W
MAGYSLKLPVATDPNDGFALLQTSKEVALQNLKMVLYTEPGERIWNLDFGVGVKTYLFEQNTEYSRRQLEIKIERQINEYLPYINIVNLSVSTFEDNEQFVKIILLFSLSGSPVFKLEETISL